MKLIILKLTLLAFICGTALSFSNVLTKSKIAQNKKQHATQQLQSVINNFDTVIESLGAKRYQIKQSNEVIGHIFEIISNEGYNGEIKLWLAVSLDNQVLGTRVISHRETPGLGDDLDIDVSDWILSFNQQTVSSIRWQVKKDGGDYDQFTGATITPRAVVAAVHAGLLMYQKNKDAFFPNDDQLVMTKE